MSTPQPLEAFDTASLAKRWGMSRHTLDNWRNLGKGPAYRKIGGKVLYFLEDVVLFEEAGKQSGSEGAQNQ